MVDEPFDLILVDGRDRVNCFYASCGFLKRGGHVILHDSERPRYSEAKKWAIKLGLYIKEIREERNTLICQAPK